MSRKILHSVELYRMLEHFDKEIASQIKQKGCSCGGRLDRADYPRKPRGLPGRVKWTSRISYCCSEEGCRKRRTPPSVRFLGRKVYVGVWVVLVTAMRQGLTGRRVATLCRELEVDRRTLNRWRDWWLKEVPQTRFWRVMSGRFMPSLEVAGLPRALIERFRGFFPAGLLKLMEWWRASKTGPPRARKTGPPES